MQLLQDIRELVYITSLVPERRERRKKAPKARGVIRDLVDMIAGLVCEPHG
jgi:hypothetical protein